MKKYQAVFTDVDGTLLTSDHQMTELTRKAIDNLQKKGIPFVIVSGRLPSGIYSFMREYGISCPIISYSGSLALDEQGEVLYQRGMTRQSAGEIIDYIEEQEFDLTWNLYSRDNWLVKDINDPRVLNEEREVGSKAREGNVDSIPEDDLVNKIMCICAPGTIWDVEEKIRKQFPNHTVVKSTDILLEIMENGVNKAEAIKAVCALLHLSTDDIIAFGDNYNDMEMLELAGRSVVMANAPEEIRRKFGYVTKDNNNDGIYYALVELKMITPCEAK